MRLIAGCFCAAALLAACDLGTRPKRGPSFLNPISPSPSPPVVSTHRLFGLVQAAGLPADGVEVRELTLQSDECATATALSGAITDSNGRYEIPDVRRTDGMWPSRVRAFKRGYFTEFKRPVIFQDTRLDFELERWAHIRLGEVVAGTLRTGGDVCEGNSYGGPCQRFALTMPAAGSLDVTLVWSGVRSDVVLDVVRPDGSPCAVFSWPGASLNRVQIVAEAGATYEIFVIDESASPLSFELATSLR